MLAQGASANDVLEFISFDVFSVNDSVSAKDGGGFGRRCISSSGTLFYLLVGILQLVIMRLLDLQDTEGLILTGQGSTD